MGGVCIKKLNPQLKNRQYLNHVYNRSQHHGIPNQVSASDRNHVAKSRKPWRFIYHVAAHHQFAAARTNCSQAAQTKPIVIIHNRGAMKHKHDQHTRSYQNVNLLQDHDINLQQPAHLYQCVNIITNALINSQIGQNYCHIRSPFTAVQMAIEKMLPIA